MLKLQYKYLQNVPNSQENIFSLPFNGEGIRKHIPSNSNTNRPQKKRQGGGLQFNAPTTSKPKKRTQITGSRRKQK